MEGAAMLSALSALKSGAGRVCLMTNEENEAFYRSRPWPVMARPDHETSGLSCLAFGMGAGRSERTRRTARELLSLKLPLVLDADAALHRRITGSPLLHTRRWSMTPHVGEAAEAAWSLNRHDPQKKRGKPAHELAARTNAVIVLNDFTVITDGAKTFIVSAPNSGLAKAGSGDVLAAALPAFCAAEPPQ